MNYTIKRSMTPLAITILATIISTIIFLGIFFVRQASAADAQNTPSGRLISLYDRGAEHVFVTKARTVGEALKDAGVELDARDTVEPRASETLVADEYKVNIYRARPVLVVDGAIRTKIITSAQTAPQIARSADVALYDEDEAVVERSDNVVADGAGLKLVITRAIPFTFTLYGKTMTSRTQASTVGAMLKEKGITLGENDRVSVGLATPITSDLSVRIWREGKQTITTDEEVNFEVETIKDANRDVGYKQVQTLGEKGSRTVTYEVVIQDGQEVGRTEIASVTTKEAKKQVEVVGTKANLPAGSHEDWMAAAGINSSDYGYVNYIFTRESGWRPSAVNSVGGYYGLGQTNLTKLSSACPNWQTDPICQIKLFNSYATGRYGSWEAAYNFWTEKHWW